jgi:hypothetical protein
MTGLELRSLIVAKWDYSYDVQIRQVGGTIYVQIMWRYLEQASFPMSEDEYMAHLDTIGAYFAAWGADSQIREFVAATKEKPRLGKAISISIDLGDRASEWLL